MNNCYKSKKNYNIDKYLLRFVECNVSAGDVQNAIRQLKEHGTYKYIKKNKRATFMRKKHTKNTSSDQLSGKNTMYINNNVEQQLKYGSYRHLLKMFEKKTPTKTKDNAIADVVADPWGKLLDDDWLKMYNEMIHRTGPGKTSNYDPFKNIHGYDTIQCVITQTMTMDVDQYKQFIDNGSIIVQV